MQINMATSLSACLRARLRTAPIRSRERQRADAQLFMTFCLVSIARSKPTAFQAVSFEQVSPLAWAGAAHCGGCRVQHSWGRQNVDVICEMATRHAKGGASPFRWLSAATQTHRLSTGGL